MQIQLLIGKYSNCENRAGIYCFWYSGIEYDFEVFKDIYQQEVTDQNYKFSKTYSKWFNHQNIYRTNINHLSLINARSFYVGKSKYVKTRIIQHIGANKGCKTTYGLHLNRVPKLLNDLSVGYWNIPNEIEIMLDTNDKYGKYIKQQLLVYIETEIRRDQLQWWVNNNKIL